MLLGGIGGGLIYYALNSTLSGLAYGTAGAAAVAAIFAVGIFFINAVVASYNIGGTIEGFHDPKFKRLPRGILASGIVSLVTGIVAVLLVLGGVF